MDQDHFWLSEAQFARLEPYLPTDTRGRTWVDDRRVISGIVHVLISGGRWKDALAAYGPRKTLYNRFRRWAAKDIWSHIFFDLAATGGPGGAADRLIGGSGTSLCFRRKRAEKNQANGRSRGARTTKIHALSDVHCRPVAFLLTGGQVADCTAADMLLAAITQTKLVHADKGYDSNEVRRNIEAKGAAPNIPPKHNRVWKNCFSPVLYRDRNAIERMFGRLKDFRRVATRYDKLAETFHATACIAAIVSYRL